jgi:voltage-gated potassium channel
MGRFMADPRVDLAVVLLILCSVSLLVVEFSLPEGTMGRRTAAQAGDVITWLFVVELSLRCWIAPRKGRFFRRYWLDILAVLPVARPLRLLRVLMLLRLFRAGVLVNRQLSFMSSVLGRTVRELLLVVTLSLMIVLLGALLVHLLGGVALDKPGLHGSLWFSLYTLVAGEPIGGLPENDTGRAITLMLMVGGLTIFGMAVGTISATMAVAMTRRVEANPMELDELSGHVVLCGWNRSGPTLLRELFADNNPIIRPVVLVTEQEGWPKDIPLSGIRRELLYHHAGDYTRVEVLEEVGISRAGMAIVLIDGQTPRSDQDKDARTVLAALTIERLCPGIFCCAELTDRQNESLLRRSGVEEIVARDWYAGVILGSVGRNQGLVKVLDDILSGTEGNSFHKVVVPKALAGTRIGELHTRLKVQHDAILISWEGHIKDEVVTIVNPPVDHVISAGDVLVVISKSLPPL